MNLSKYHYHHCNEVPIRILQNRCVIECVVSKQPNQPASFDRISMSLTLRLLSKSFRRARLNQSIALNAFPRSFSTKSNDLEKPVAKENILPVRCSSEIAIF